MTTPTPQAPGNRPLARCRWCDRNDVSFDDMAIMSYKPSYGGFTGVCKTCINSEQAEAAYHARMFKQQNPST